MTCFRCASFRTHASKMGGGAEGEEPDAKLAAMLGRDEVARSITQVYCLERLAAGDTATARLMLSALAQARLCAHRCFA